ncbi:hypothetical protein [Aurantimonas sp. 22II-16-19i]|uniref:hypothetical protein n=1 Tax=Aurantimonas sp. 22II-16-19i TaxID=1317114 RepID=UPI0009F7C002|nr:hypothetical protein [Aurantimonas sp. 22II-16-19i]ORE89726.1 hypothetical protein ATO4_23647 [Aurantimonas sp. 22II-16-19i]
MANTADIAGLTVSLPLLLGFGGTLAAVLGAWYDLRARSLSNSRQITELEIDLEKQRAALQTELDKEMAAMGRRVESADLKAGAVAARLEVHEERFHNYRVEAAEKFVTSEQLERMRVEMTAGFQRIEEKLDRRSSPRSG